MLETFEMSQNKNNIYIYKVNNLKILNTNIRHYFKKLKKLKMNKTLAVRSDEAEKYLLYAKLDNAKILFNLAKAVNFKEV